MENRHICTWLDPNDPIFATCSKLPRLPSFTRHHQKITGYRRVPGRYASASPWRCWAQALSPASLRNQSLTPLNYLSIHIWERTIKLPIYPSIHPSIHLSIYPSIYPSIHLSIHPSINLSVSSVCQSVNLSVAMYICFNFGADDAMFNRKYKYWTREHPLNHPEAPPSPPGIPTQRYLWGPGSVADCCVAGGVTETDTERCSLREGEAEGISS